jgi:hypothetical protein
MIHLDDANIMETLYSVYWSIVELEFDWTQTTNIIFGETQRSKKIAKNDEKKKKIVRLETT